MPFPVAQLLAIFRDPHRKLVLLAVGVLERFLHLQITERSADGMNLAT